MQNPFTIFQSEDNGQWYWHLKAANGQIVAASEGYTTKQSARVGIAAVRTAVPAGFYDDDPCEESVA